MRKRAAVMSSGTMRSWQEKLARRPLGVTLLILYCFISAGRSAVRLPSEATVLNLASIVFWLILGVGLFRLRKWAWALSLFSALAFACVSSYFAWKIMNSTSGSPPSLLRVEIRTTTIFLMVFVYLVDHHIRKVFLDGWPTRKR